MTGGPQDEPTGDRAQAHTLEAVAAAILLLASIVFALQVTAVTPLTASTSSQHIENQQGAIAEGLLESSEDSIEETILRWNHTGGVFWNAGEEGVYANGGPPTAFGEILNETFREQGVAFNVNVYYLTEDGRINRQRVVYVGGPSDHATVATKRLTLRDDQVLRDADGNPTDKRLGATPYFAPDARPNSPVYNHVVVEVVVWRM